MWKWTMERSELQTKVPVVFLLDFQKACPEITAWFHLQMTLLVVY